MTYPKALVFGIVMGLGIWIGMAASKSSTAVEAAPYAAGAGAVVALAMCALVSYRNGQTPRR